MFGKRCTDCQRRVGGFIGANNWGTEVTPLCRTCFDNRGQKASAAISTQKQRVSTPPRTAQAKLRQVQQAAQQRVRPSRNVSQAKKLSKGDLVILALFISFVLVMVYKVASCDLSKQPNYSNESGVFHHSVGRTCTCSRYVNGKYAGDYQVQVGQWCGSTQCQ